MRELDRERDLRRRKKRQLGVFLLVNGEVGERDMMGSKVEGRAPDLLSCEKKGLLTQVIR